MLFYLKDYFAALRYFVWLNHTKKNYEELKKYALRANILFF